MDLVHIVRRIKELEIDGRVEPEKSKVTFDDAAAAVVTDYKINRRRSLADVKRRITLHLTPFFEGRRLSVIDKREVQQYIADRLDAGATNASINRELTILKRAFTLAEIPRPAFRMLRDYNTRQGFFEADQLAAVLAHLLEALRPVIRFAAITGWRVRSEVLPLEWRHVDLRAGEVRLDLGTTKNQEGRTFPLTDALRTLLTERKTLADAPKASGVICPWVFHRHGKPIRDFQRLGSGLQGRRLSGSAGPRLAPDRRPESRAGRRAADSRDEDDRAQNRQRVPPL
jgi:integrase